MDHDKAKNVLRAWLFDPKLPDICQQDDVDMFRGVIVGVPERSPNLNQSISQQSTKRPAHSLVDHVSSTPFIVGDVVLIDLQGNLAGLICCPKVPSSEVTAHALPHRYPTE